MKPRVVYEDPAAALNVSEGQWNEIVQNNLKKYHEENAKAPKDKKYKNLAVYEEQKKQIETRKAIVSQEKLKDKEFFRQIGVKASDIYYVNEDARKERSIRTKGGAKDVAVELKKKHAESLNER